MQLWLKLGIAGGCLFMFGTLFGFAIFPPFLRSQLKKQVTLKPGGDIRDMWEVVPFALDFRVFLFNITNPDEIKAGAKPIVNEVGPFFYDEYKEKVDLVDNNEEDTCEYSNKATWMFAPEKSGVGLSEDTVLTFPHVMILTLILTVVREKPGMMGLAAKAVDSIFKKPDSVFVKATVREILWTGLPVDCTVQDFQGKAVCSLLAENEAAFIVEGPGKYRFALLGAKNGTVVPDRFKVRRGIKNYRQTGEMVSYKGEERQKVWADDGPCNALPGTDSTIFHPLLFQDEDIVSFSPDMCLSLPAYYVKPSKVKGLKTNHYNADFGDMNTDENLKCLCTAPDKCLKKGLIDLFTCLGAPMVASLPHFYLVDPFYLTQVDGLHPNQEEHQIFINFEPMTATPVEARKRLQFNMFIFPIEKFKLMKTFPEALLPLFWVEEGLLLGDEFVKQLKVVFTMIKVVGVMKYLMMFGGIGLAGTSGFLKYRDMQASQKLSITKISPKATANATAPDSGEKRWPLNINTVQAQSVPALDG
ncbi:sensory neuron membrane protein 1 isoform X1 [Diachasma alloeum]|uniref:sensory neuron membrane protein 1 isoform X1 n=1 Tax=Diachasma alloeum TaxID=454923 RepID=UPI0007383640|nr:sensory neuron membrane protein 1 isoform X1 [Diachasma alloeum]